MNTAFTEERPRMSLGRSLAIWSGCYAMIGVLLFFYGGIGLVPIAVAGLLTLGVTLYRYFRPGGPR